MLTKLLLPHTESESPRHKEGDLFKIIQYCGNTFEIRYGFYEERDRHSQYAEPIEIYPDFTRNPQYTDEGIPFVTAIQHPCEHFYGDQDHNSNCEECAFYQHGEELIGICICPKNRRSMRERQNE